MRQFLVVGLGNYTHPHTRHSVGQLVLDAMAQRTGLVLRYDRDISGWLSDGPATLDRVSTNTSRGKKLHDEEKSAFAQLTMLKPKLLMNISGPSVAKAAHQPLTPFNSRSIIVLHDSLDVNPFSLKPKFDGSANGHNGVRSVITALGTAQFHRLKIGIGRGPGDVKDYVLNSLSSREVQFWGSTDGGGVDLVWKAIQEIATKETRS